MLRTSAEFRPGLNYLMFLLMEISFLLLGPHISHIVLVVFKAHLGDSSPVRTSCSANGTDCFPTDHKSKMIVRSFLRQVLTLYSPIQSQELREKLAAILNLAVASAILFHSSSTESVTSGISTL